MWCVFADRGGKLSQAHSSGSRGDSLPRARAQRKAVLSVSHEAWDGLTPVYFDHPPPPSTATLWSQPRGHTTLQQATRLSTLHSTLLSPHDARVYVLVYSSKTNLCRLGSRNLLRHLERDAVEVGAACVGDNTASTAKRTRERRGIECQMDALDSHATIQERLSRSHLPTAHRRKQETGNGSAERGQGITRPTNTRTKEGVPTGDEHARHNSPVRVLVKDTDSLERPECVPGNRGRTVDVPRRLCGERGRAG